jgi:hypothetical protein
MNMRETKIENLSKAIAGRPQVMNFFGVVVFGAVLGALDGVGSFLSPGTIQMAGTFCGHAEGELVAFLQGFPLPQLPDGRRDSDGLGRSAAAKAMGEAAVPLAVTARVWHRKTNTTTSWRKDNKGVRLEPQ